MTTADYEDVQCGRCGSSMNWEDCDGCGSEGTYEEEGDCLEPPRLRTCPACGGKGGWWVCLSDYNGDVNGNTWCEGNPRPGRLKVPCSAVEEFAVHPDGTTTYKRGGWAELIEDGREMTSED